MSDPRPPETEEITQEFPAVGADPSTKRDGVLVWGGLGAVIALVALIVFADGLRSPGTDTPPGAATTSRTIDGTRTATSGGSSTTDTTTASRAVLTVTATDDAGVATEVRSIDADGEVLFQGIIAEGASRRFTIPPSSTLWLSLAWAPSAQVSVNGVVQSTADGTAAFIVGSDGLTPVGPSAAP